MKKTKDTKQKHKCNRETRGPEEQQKKKHK